MMTEIDNDSKWMREALMEAARGRGLCSPNPMVGAVIVGADGACLSRGYHRQAGCAHAEINALKGLPAGADLADATLYVTLEPCTTWGRTPPCCDAILKAGIRRVVIGCLDDNPKHGGAAVERLRAAGVEVRVGVLETDCRRLNEHFFWWITRRRPWVVLKMAMSLDGRIALPDGTSKWITGPASRQRVQELRQLAGMIMVGGQTARMDDPSLTVREPADWPRQPVAAVWTRQPLPPTLSLLRQQNRQVITVQADTKVAWDAFLSEWGAKDITMLLLEGGGELAANALSCGIVNQIQFFIAPKIIGGRDSVPVVGGAAPATLADALRLRDIRIETVGDGEMLYVGYPCNCTVQ